MVRHAAVAASVALAIAAAFLAGTQVGRRAAVRTLPAAGSATPAASPTPTPSTPGRVVVHATGDVNLDPAYVTSLRSNGYDHPWNGVRALFTSDSVTIVNLECSASRLGTAQEKDYTFRCEPDALPAMRAAGVDVAGLGNNHAQDFGAEAMLDARRALAAAGVLPAGAGRDAAEAARPAVIATAGRRVAVLGFGGVVPDRSWVATPGRPGMADGDDAAAMVAAVRAASAVADLVFVTIHWGVELDTRPRAEDVARARAMIDAGADGVFGHHAHRLQPMEVYAGRPVFWGLGNFVWPRMTAAANATGVAEVVVEPDGRVNGCLLPAVIASNGRPVLSQPYAVPCAP